MASTTTAEKSKWIKTQLEEKKKGPVVEVQKTTTTPQAPSVVTTQPTVTTGSRSGGTAAATGQTEVPQTNAENTAAEPTERRNTPSAEYIMPSYDPAADAAYQNAVAALTAAKQNAPRYAGTYDQPLLDAYNAIVNRDAFRYDINADALYQQYAQQYADMGQMAMRDTMGQAAALTGGYGSSYGQSVGQQQYDAYLQRLNDVVPELYQQAYSRYRDEGNDLAQRYAMLGDLRDTEYGQYQDDYNRWLTERNFAQNEADTAYQRSVDDYNRRYSEWSYRYGMGQDRAETLAAAGDFSGYADLYGQDAADSLQSTWAFKNPDIAYRNGIMSAEEYKNIVGEYPAGYTPPEGTNSGWYSPSAYPDRAYKDGIISAEQYRQYTGKNPTGDGNGSDDQPLYTSGDLRKAAASGKTKAQIENDLRAIGVDPSNPAVQEDIRIALSK